MFWWQYVFRMAEHISVLNTCSSCDVNKSSAMSAIALTSKCSDTCFHIIYMHNKTYWNHICNRHFGYARTAQMGCKEICDADGDVDGDDFFFLRISFLCSNHCWKCFVIVFKEMTCRFLFQAKWHFSKILQSRFLFAVNFLGFSQFYWVCSVDEIRINGRSALKVMQHPASKCLQRENFVATIKSLPAGFFERSTQIIHQTFFSG